MEASSWDSKIQMSSDSSLSFQTPSQHLFSKLSLSQSLSQSKHPEQFLKAQPLLASCHFKHNAKWVCLNPICTSGKFVFCGNRQCQDSFTICSSNCELRDLEPVLRTLLHIPKETKHFFETIHALFNGYVEKVGTLLRQTEGVIQSIEDAFSESTLNKYAEMVHHLQYANRQQLGQLFQISESLTKSFSKPNFPEQCQLKGFYKQIESWSLQVTDHMKQLETSFKPYQLLAEKFKNFTLNSCEFPQNYRAELSLQKSDESSNFKSLQMSLQEYSEFGEQDSNNIQSSYELQRPSRQDHQMELAQQHEKNLQNSWTVHYNYEEKQRRPLISSELQDLMSMSSIATIPNQFLERYYLDFLMGRYSRFFPDYNAVKQYQSSFQQSKKPVQIDQVFFKEKNSDVVFRNKILMSSANHIFLKTEISQQYEIRLIPEKLSSDSHNIPNTCRLESIQSKINGKVQKKSYSSGKAVISYTDTHVLMIFYEVSSESARCECIVLLPYDKQDSLQILLLGDLAFRKSSIHEIQPFLVKARQHSKIEFGFDNERLNSSQISAILNFELFELKFERERAPYKKSTGFERNQIGLMEDSSRKLPMPINQPPIYQEDIYDDSDDEQEYSLSKRQLQEQQEDTDSNELQEFHREMDRQEFDDEPDSDEQYGYEY